MGGKIKKVFGLMICLALILSLVPVAAFAADVNYGRSYSHIDVKVDGQYAVSVDGEEVTLNGTFMDSSIKVKIGNTVYDFADYRVKTQTEDGRREYEISVRSFSPSLIQWVEGTYKMTNVYVSGRMLFESVPQALKEILPTTVIGSKTYYYIDIENYQYEGVQECTGGRGLRSEGNSGTASGLDLYIKAQGLEVYITKGRLAIEKVIVNEAGQPIDDTAQFEYTVTGPNNFSTSVTVAGGSKRTLENLPAGTYTITETQKPGYSIRYIDGETTADYSKDYVVKVKEDSDIPVAVFTNTKLTEKSAVSIAKTADGLPQGSVYPDPTVSIYAAENGQKTGTALWSGTLEANGDVLYPSVYFAPGTYIVEETGAGVEKYNCTAALKVKDSAPSTGMLFTVASGDTNIALVLNNSYAPAPVEDVILLEIPFIKDVVLGGPDEPGEQNFTFEVYDFGAGSDDYGILGTLVQTDGAGRYNGKLVITVPENQYQEALDNISEGFLIKEIKESAPDWTYDETIWRVVPQVNRDTNEIEELRFYNTNTVQQNDASYVTELIFTNTYTHGEIINYTSLTVKKEWRLDNGGTAADSVKVMLYCNGQAYGEVITLNEANGWTHTWENLDDRYTWTADETEVPEGFDKKAVTQGNTITIINDDIAIDPLDDDIAIDPIDDGGDNTNVLLWTFLLSICGAGLAAIAVKGKRKA